MLVYYMTCIFLVIYSLLELQSYHQRIGSIVGHTQHAHNKKKRWRKKKPFRQKDGCFHRRAQRRKRRQLLRHRVQGDNQKTSFLQELWRQQINWYSCQDYFDLDQDSWFSDSTYCKSSSRFLYLSPYATEFDRLCSVQPCIVDLVLGKEGYFSPLKENTHRLLDLAFASGNKAMDLT